MPELPELDCSLLIRTDFTSDGTWREVRDQALREYEEGFRAYLEPVSREPQWDGCGVTSLPGLRPGRLGHRPHHQ
jgi:hypothetical protein